MKVRLGHRRSVMKRFISKSKSVNFKFDNSSTRNPA
jgi:hypothetical protein